MDVPDPPRIEITQTGRYRFEVDFGAAFAPFAIDEPQPIGDETAPAPEQLLAASVAYCLSASLFFALSKYRQDAGAIRASAECAVERNAAGRLRITAIDVDIRLAAAADTLTHLDRALAQFEPFCTVSESVQAGIPVNVSVSDGNGRRLR
ncbi:MAG: OsmC family protein [Pseudazoarcus pumilus]|nr:OsmC family protein [Pseudazoarcus pumilus]